MTEFIRLEAQEKAREIQLKADEDFEKDKASLILQEKAVIDAAYDAKFKQAAMSLQITRSKAHAKARITTLSAGQRVVDDIFDAAQKKLLDATKNSAGKKGYQEALRNLILDGMYHLNEDNVIIRCRRADKGAVEKVLGGVLKEFEEELKRPAKAAVDESEWLPENG
jgi:V-type H+-transporting ATPase subunit E